MTVCRDQIAVGVSAGVAPPRRPAVQAIGRWPLYRDVQHELVDGARNALEQRWRGWLAIFEVPSRSVDSGRQRSRLEEAEERPELVLDHQGVTVSAAGCGEQHRLADEIGRRDKVEQVLEEPGVAALVNRARDHECVGADDLFKRLPCDRRQIVDLGCTAERRGKLADIEDDATTTQAAGRLPDDSFHERPCLRRATEIAGDADDPRDHYCSPEVASSSHRARPSYSAAMASADFAYWLRARLRRPSTDTGTSPAMVTRRTTRC